MTSRAAVAGIRMHGPCGKVNLLPDEIARDDFDPSDAVDFWDLVNRQDWPVCEQVQDGMNSRMFTADYLAPMEQPSADVSHYVTRRLGARRSLRAD